MIFQTKKRESKSSTKNPQKIFSAVFLLLLHPLELLSTVLLLKYFEPYMTEMPRTAICWASTGT